jgi:hypothetical protein
MRAVDLKALEIFEKIENRHKSQEMFAEAWLSQLQDQAAGTDLDAVWLPKGTLRRQDLRS